MKTKKSDTKNRLIVIIAGLFCLAMILFPKVTEEGSKTAIIIWINSIVPVLMPFFIFSDFIKRTGDLSRLPVGLYPFAVAFLSGYPMGAKVTGDLIREKRVTLDEGKRILAYSLVTGPAFIIFTIGTFIGSTKAAVVVAICHYLGALAGSLLCSNGRYRGKGSRGNIGREGRKGDSSGKPKSTGTASIGETGASRAYLENFSSAIVQSCKGMAMILAYLMVFTIAVNIMEHLGLFTYLANETLSACIKGCFEMTIGINILGMCDIGIKLKTILAATLVSFGGMSVIGQSVSMLAGSGFRISHIVKIKVIHGIIAGILATLMINIVVI